MSDINVQQCNGVVWVSVNGGDWMRCRDGLTMDEVGAALDGLFGEILVGGPYPYKPAWYGGTLAGWIDVGDHVEPPVETTDGLDF